MRGGRIDLIVSDSPIFLQYFYCNYHNSPGQEAILRLSQEMDSLYPSLNIFLERNDKYYDEVGRYEKLPEAKKIDVLLKKLLEQNNISFVSFSCENIDDIMKYIISNIGEDE